MSVLVPPRGQRLRFWVLGLRLPLEYRPWVYEQVTAAGYLQRRRWLSVIVPAVCIVVPQGLTAYAEHSWWRALLPSLALVAFVPAALSRRQLDDLQLRRVLAVYGLTPEGALIEPVPFWASNPLGKAGLVLLVAQLLVFSSGLAVVYDHRAGCHPVPAASVRAIRALMGVPRPGPAPAIPGVPVDPPAYDVAPGSALVSARQIGTAFDGMHYVAAYVRDRDGRLLGPGVWRVIDPGTTFLLPTIEVHALDVNARRLTPSSGASYGDPAEFQLTKARSCARWAR